MPIEGLPPVIPNTSVLAPVSDWGTRLIAPLSSSLMSKDGMFELAGRVYWIVGLVILAAVWAAKNGYLTGHITPPNSSSNKPTGNPTQSTGGSLPTSSGKETASEKRTEKSYEVVTPKNGNSTVSTGSSSTISPNVSSKPSVENSAMLPENRNANTNGTGKSFEVVIPKSDNSTVAIGSSSNNSAVSPKDSVENSTTVSGVDAYVSGIDKSSEIFSKKRGGSNEPSMNSIAVSMPDSSDKPVNTSVSSEANILPGYNTPMSDTYLTDSLSLGSGFDPIARPNFDALSKTIEGDVEKIHQNFYLSSQKLQSCKPGSSDYQALIDDFKRKAGNFCKVYGPYQKAFDPSCFLTVKKYEAILTELNDISRGIIRVKGDGNCLFHSFTVAFSRMKSYLVQFELWDARFTSHEYLRGAVNAYMQKNYESDPTLKLLIDDAIYAHVEAKKKDISLQKESEQYKLDNAQQLKEEGFEIDEDEVKFKLQQLQVEENSLDAFSDPSTKYTQYFNQFGELGFFAAFAAAYAMCKILNDQIGIRIADEPGRQITAEYDAFNEHARIIITLVFKGDHFDVKFPEGFIY